MLGEKQISSPSGSFCRIREEVILSLLHRAEQDPRKGKNEGIEMENNVFLIRGTFVKQRLSCTTEVTLLVEVREKVVIMFRT